MILLLFLISACGHGGDDEGWVLDETGGCGNTKLWARNAEHTLRLTIFAPGSLCGAPPEDGLVEIDFAEDGVLSLEEGEMLSVPSCCWPSISIERVDREFALMEVAALLEIVPFETCDTGMYCQGSAHFEASVLRFASGSEPIVLDGFMIEAEVGCEPFE